MNRFKWITAATLLAGMAFATTPARATLLLPGGSAVPNAEPTDPFAGTTTLANTGVQNFSEASSSETLVGTGQAWVVTNYSGNPFGLGSLTFIYQVSLTGGMSGSVPSIVERLTMSNFSTFSTDVGYYVQSAGQRTPPNATRSGNGTVVAFDFTSLPIQVGQTTALLKINTNATLFTSGTLTVQNGLTANLNGFAPTLAPEPSTVATALTGLGLVGLGALRRKFRKPA